jgi:hypothetical protein
MPRKSDRDILNEVMSEVYPRSAGQSAVLSSVIKLLRQNRDSQAVFKLGPAQKWLKKTAEEILDIARQLEEKELERDLENMFTNEAGSEIRPNYFDPLLTPEQTLEFTSLTDGVSEN